MDDERQRVEGAFKKFLDENKKKFEYIDNTQTDIDSRLNNLRGKVFENIKKNCMGQWKWIEQRGSLKFTEKGIQVDVVDNTTNDADVYLKEFDVCASQNDFGLNQYFKELKGKENLISSMNQGCLNTCFTRTRDKTEKDLELCLANCFNKTFKDMDEILEATKLKIIEVDNKLVEKQ